MKYDDASWHYGGEFPSSSPQKFGGTHIALFMKWCFIKGFAGDLHKSESPAELAKVIAGEMSATDYFMKFADGKLTSEDFNAEGNDFALTYYKQKGLYFDDYVDIFYDKLYVADEREHDFKLLSGRIDRRYQSLVLKEKLWRRFLKKF